MEEQDVTQCKFFDWEQATRNGKGCVRNRTCPSRCWYFIYTHEICIDFKKNDLENEKV